MTRRPAAAFTAAALAGVVACGEPNRLIEVANLVVAPDSASVVLGRTFPLSAVAFDRAGVPFIGAPTTWSSDNDAVARVSDRGVVTGMALGMATVTVTSGTLSASAHVVVTPAPLIQVAPDTVSFGAVANGPDPGPDSAAVTNGGGNVLSGLSVDTIRYGAGAADWLTASLDNGAAPATLTLTATSAGLALGTYRASVVITAPLASNSPDSVHVMLTVVAGVATQIATNGGDAQTATVGTPVATPPSVVVRDQYDNPVAGAAVTFAVASGGGGVTGANATTDASGVATVGSWTLGTAAGGNSLTATSGSLSGSPVTFTATGTPDAPALATVSAGDGQSATAGSAVAVAPAILVQDQHGNPVAGVSVTFAIASGGGGVTGGAQLTDAGGIATVGSWTLGTTAGPNSLTAAATGVATPVTFTATATAGAAAQIASTAGDGQSAPVGTAVTTPPTVRVTDQFGNPVSGVPVTFAVGSGGGGITSASPVTAADGFAAVGSWTLGTTAGANTLSATAPGLSGSPVTFSATATAGAATQMAVNAGNGQSATVNAAVATPPSVLVRDQFNNPVAGVPVTFAVTAGGGGVTGGGATTNASGVAAVGSWTLGTAAGPNALSATSSGLAGSPITFTATGTAGAATQIALSAGNGQTATVNTTVATAPAVLVRDQFANPVSGVTVTFAVTGGGGSVTGSAASTNASGMATVGSWTLGTTAGASNNTLGATSTGLTGSPVTFTASATAGAATQIALNAGNGQTATVGTAVAIAPSVLVRDQFSNPVQGVGVTFAVTGGGGSIVGGAAATNASGVAQVTSWTVGPSAGANTLSATSSGLAGSPVGFTATGTASAATQIALSAGDNQTATVNTAVAVSPSVLVRDQFSNPVAGVAVTFAVTGGGGSVTGGSATTNASGIATVGSWTLGQTAGTNTLTATSGGLSGSPVGFTATGAAAAASQIALNAGDNQTATVNTAVAVNPSVLVRDQFNNPVAGVAVTFAVTGGGGSVSGGSATTNASGIATVTSWTLGQTAGANTLTATAAGLAGSPVGFAATGTAGAATQIAVSAGDNQSATVNTAVATAPAVLVRDAFNNPVAGIGVTFAIASGGGSVSGGSATTNAGGIATPTSWTLGSVAGTNTLTATSPGLAGSPLTFTATGTAATATQITLSAGNNQTATVNTAVATAPAVLVRDQFSNPVAGVSVTFAVTGGGGSLTGASATTNASGIATVGSWTLGTTAGIGNNTLSATSTGLAGSPLTFTASAAAGAATQIALSAGNGQTATVNTAVAVNPAVLVRDQFNNPKSGVSVTFAVGLGNGGVTGGSATTNASGIATVGSWTLDTLAGGDTLTATSAGLSGSPVTFTATGTAGAATQIALNAGNGQTATVNTAVAVAPSVVVRDQFNNPKSGASVTFAASGGGGVTGGSATTDASGIATVGAWRLDTLAGANTLTATSSGLTGSPVTFNATGTAGAATQIAVNAGNNQSAQANTAVPIPPSVVVRDAFGNPVAGHSVTFAVNPLVGGGGTVDPTTPLTTDAGGTAQVTSWTLDATAGANELFATASPALTGSPVTFTATGFSGTATQMALDGGDGQTDTVGATLPIPYSVLVQDASSNPVSGVPVSWAVTGGGGSIAPTSDTTDVNGIATAFRTYGTTAGTQRATASVGGLTGSPVEFTGTATPGTASQVAANGGNGQSATVNTAVAVDPSVLVTDEFGNPVSGVSVTFAVGIGGGSVGGGSTTTNASGIATVGSWTLGTTAGTNTNTLTATSAGLSGSPVTFTASATAGAAATLAISAGEGQTATVNTAVATDPAVLVTDAFGNPVPGASVTFAVTAGGGSVAGSPATTNASGVATVTSWTLGTTTGANTLHATLAALTPVDFTATGTAGPAATIAVNGGNNQTATVNTAVAVAPSALVTDQFGNPVAGTTVTFAVTGGGGNLTGASPVSNGSGVAALGSWTLGTVAGASNNTLSATASGLAGSPLAFTASATAGAATQMALDAGDGQSANVNTAVATAPSVVVRDQFNNLVSGQSITFTVTAGGGSTTPASPASVPSNAGGIAALSAWTLGPTAGTNTLSATAALTGSPITFTATATAATPTTIALNAGDNQTATVNTAVAVAPSVIVRDQFSNPVGGVAVTFAVTGGGGSVTGENAVTDAGGIATLGSWTLGTTAGTGNNTLTATSGGLTGSPVTFTASAAAGAATQIALDAGDNQTATVNTAVAIDPSVIVRDAFSNPVAGVSVTFAVGLGSGGITGGNATTNASGIATVGSWTLGTAAGTSNNTLTATNGALSGSPVTFTASATAGAATQIALNAGNNQTATVNTAVATAPAVLVRDQFNNPVSGVSVTFAVTSAGGSVLSGNATTNAGGIAAPTSWTLGTTAGTNTDTLTATSGSLIGSPVTFVASASAGTPATLAIDAGDGQTATVNTAVATDPAVLVTDAFGNPVPSVGVTFAVTGGGGSVAGSPATTSAAGIATLTSWTLGTTAGANTLQATLAALTPVDFTATGTADAAAVIAVNGGNGQSATVNTAVAVAPSALVTDQHGNPVSGISVTFAVTSGGGTVDPVTAILSDASGVAQVTSWTLGTTAGANTLSATSSPVLTGSPLAFTATGTAGTATQMALNAGNGQSATVNTAVATDPSVLVRDAFNNPVQGVSITFTITGGGGTLSPASPASIPTDVNGIAAVTSWTLGTTAGSNTLSATNGALSGSPVNFTATGNPGAVSAAQSSVVDGAASITACSASCTVLGGTADSVTVTVRDAFANPINGASVTVSSTGTGNTFTPAAAGTTNSSGVFATKLSSTVAQAKTISAVANAVSITSGNPTVTVNAAAGNVTTSTVSASDGAIVACSASCSTGGNTASLITVTVRDAFNNVVPSVTVTPSCFSGSSCTFVPSSGSTNASGVFTTTFNSTLAQAKTIRAVIAAGQISQTAAVTVSAAAAANVTINTGNSQTAAVGLAVTTDPSVVVTDAFGNAVSGQTVTFLIVEGGGSVVGSTPVTNASGVATVTSWTMGATGTEGAEASGTFAGQFENRLKGRISGVDSVEFLAHSFYRYATDVAPIIGTASGCQGCHYSSWTYGSIVGVNQQDGVGYTSCTIANSVDQLIDISNASLSLIYVKTAGTNVGGSAPCGGSMPSSAGLTAAQRTILRAWINDGALNN